MESLNNEEEEGGFLRLGDTRGSSVARKSKSRHGAIDNLILDDEATRPIEEFHEKVKDLGIKQKELTENI
jgi:hypothetical protein